MADKKYVQTSRLIQTTSILSCTVTEKVCTSKIMKLISNGQNTSHSWQNEFIRWDTLTYFSSGALYRTKQLFISETNYVKKGCSLSIEPFPIVSVIEIIIWTQQCSQNLLLSACFCWASRLSSREIHQNYKFVGTIAYGDSYLEFLFRHFKVFRLHAILLDAGGSVKAHSGKSPDYCYMIVEGRSYCSLGHLTGLLFCLHVQLFLPCIFNSIDNWSSMSCIVLDNEFAHKIVIKELGVLFSMGMFKETHFVLQKTTNRLSKQFGEQETCTALCGTVVVWITLSFPIFFIKM